MMRSACAVLLLAAPALAGTGDALALLQMEVKATEKDDTNLFDMLKGMMEGAQLPGGLPFKLPEGLPFKVPDLPVKMPAGMKMPSMEDMMSMAMQAMELLRNKPFVSVLQGAIRNVTEEVRSATEGIHQRDSRLHIIAKSATHKDLIRGVVGFMREDVALMKPELALALASFTKVVGAMPTGKAGRKVKMGLALVEPMAMQAWDAALMPLMQGFDELGNGTEVHFCKNLLPFVANATKGMALFEQADTGIAKMKTDLPQQIKSIGPLSFMAPDLVPVLTDLGERMLDFSDAQVDYLQARLQQVNTTFREILRERLACDRQLESAAPRAWGARLLALALAPLAALVALA